MMPPAPPPPPTKTVLLVEDETSTLRFYMAGLKGLHEFRLLAAENGRQALALLQDHSVDVVVTDLNMPVMDGYGLIAALARKYPALPVIVITAVADPALRDQALELGALKILSKPPKLSMLMEVIREAASVPAQGLVRGLPLASVLQLMAWERRSATLMVKAGPGQEQVKGYLYVKEGELIHAALGREEGLLAAYRILTGEMVELEFVGTCQVPATIDLPLGDVLQNVALIQEREARPGTGVAVKDAGIWYD